MRLQLGEFLSIFMSVGLHGLGTVVWVQMSALRKDAEIGHPSSTLGAAAFCHLSFL